MFAQGFAAVNGTLIIQPGDQLRATCLGTFRTESPLGTRDSPQRLSQCRFLLIDASSLCEYSVVTYRYDDTDDTSYCRITMLHLRHRFDSSERDTETPAGPTRKQYDDSSTPPSVTHRQMWATPTTTKCATCTLWDTPLCPSPCGASTDTLPGKT
eukprot:3893927-Pyramimonas_sp.AAC.1